MYELRLGPNGYSYHPQRKSVKRTNQPRPKKGTMGRLKKRPMSPFYPMRPWLQTKEHSSFPFSAVNEITRHVLPMRGEGSSLAPKKMAKASLLMDGDEASNTLEKEVRTAASYLHIS